MRRAGLGELSRQGEEEGSAVVEVAFRPGAPAMPIDDTANIGKSDTGAFEIRGAMEPLEDAKQLVGITWIEADAVIANEDDVFGLAGAAAELDARDFPRAGIFNGVADQVYEYLPQQGRIGFDFGQFGNEPFDLPATHLLLEVGDDVLDQVGQGQFGFVEFRARGAGKGEQIVNQAAHLFGGIRDGLEVTGRFARQTGGLRGEKDFNEAFDMAEWRAQVVRN